MLLLKFFTFTAEFKYSMLRILNFLQGKTGANNNNNNVFHFFFPKLSFLLLVLVRRSEGSWRWLFLICNDVLVDVFNFYGRRQLAQLERVCRRFNQIVVRFFNEAPFLILALECYVDEKSSRFSKILSSSDIEKGPPIHSERKVCFLIRG